MPGGGSSIVADSSTLIPGSNGFHPLDMKFDSAGNLFVSNPIPNVPVVWQALTPQSVSLAGAASTSDAHGLVSATAILGSVGQSQVQLKIANLSVQTVFLLQGSVTLTGISVVSGIEQVTAPGAGFAQPIVLQVSAAERQKPSYQNSSTTISVIALLFSFSTTYVSNRRIGFQDIQSNHQQLRTILQRLPEALQHGARVLEQLVEKQDTVVRERDLARAGLGAAAHQPGGRHRVVRGAKRTRADQRDCLAQSSVGRERDRIEYHAAL